MAVFDSSRYVKTPLFDRVGDNKLIFKIRKRFTFNEDLAETHLWEVGDSLDRVAYTYYGNPNLRWAILDANPSFKTEFDIKVGDYILIPSYDEITEILNG